MKKAIDMCNGPLVKNMIIYTIPIILTGILQLLFNAADLVIVGRYCGSISVAAVGATSPLIHLIINLFMGLSVGAGVTVAQAYGAKDYQKVCKTVHTAIPVAVIGGAILSLVGVIFAEAFLLMMGTPENVLHLSAVYMKIYFCGMIPSMIYNFGAAILRAAGDTKGPLVYLTLAGVINVILNIIFVLFFHMNVDGVGLATSISQMISAFLIIRALMKRNDACKLQLKLLHIDKTALLKMIQIGLPAGIQGSLFSISNVLIQSSINSFGEIVMSGNAAAANIDAFAYTTVNAFHQTTTNFVGQNAGAKQYDRIKKIMKAAFLMVTVAGLIVGLSLFIFARPLLSIYIVDSMDAIEYGVLRLAYIGIFYAMCGIMDTATGALRGIGRSVEPMIICVAGVCVLRIIWIYTVFQIPAYHSPVCLYLSYVVSWTLTGIVEIIVFYKTLKKLQKNNEKCVVG